jgi:hypothetical protein
VAQAESDPRNRDNTRFSILADHFVEQNVHLINTQESTQVTKLAFEKVGYRSIDSDSRPVTGEMVPDDVCGTSASEKNNEEYSPDETEVIKKVVPAQAAQQAVTRESDWRGLVSYYDPSVYCLDDDESTKFEPYLPENQKSWPEVWSAFGKLMRSLVTISRLSDVRNMAGDLIVSFSGVARKDGILIAHLKHVSSGRHIILCNTHLESFHHNIRERQISELIDRINSLRKVHAESIIILAGDFNTPQVAKYHQKHYCEGLADRLRQPLGAVTMDEKHIVDSLIKGADIDGVYFIPPQGALISEIAGGTYLPKDRSDPDVQWSDHCAVMVTARVMF